MTVSTVHGLSGAAGMPLQPRKRALAALQASPCLDGLPEGCKRFLHLPAARAVNATN